MRESINGVIYFFSVANICKVVKFLMLITLTDSYDFHDRSIAMQELLSYLFIRKKYSMKKMLKTRMSSNISTDRG